MAKKSREIAPRLHRGIRERTFNRLPPEIKNSLRGIARDENKSMSWVLEQVIIDYFGLTEPRYREVKNNERS